MSSVTELKNIFLRNPMFFWGYISMHYPLSSKQIELLEDNLFWGLIPINSEITFTIPLIEKYYDLLNKEDLVYCNNSITDDSEVFKYLNIKIDPFLKEEYLEYNNKKSKTDADYHPSVRYHKLTPEVIEKNLDTISWSHFSSNELIKWNKEILYKYKDYLWFGEKQKPNEHYTDALELYNNEAVPWDIEIIKLFENKVLYHKELITCFLFNRTMIKNIKPFITEDFFYDVLIELKF